MSEIELPDDDPRMLEFTKNLMQVMGSFIGEELTSYTMYQIDDAVDNMRANFKLTYGYDIPKLVAVILPSSRHISLFRADLTTENIHIVITNLMREFAVRKIPVNKQELAVAVTRAWPHYDPAIEVFAADGQAKKAFIH
jgi:hypothetical protein